jgi:hypothetical protein
MDKVLIAVSDVAGRDRCVLGTWIRHSWLAKIFRPLVRKSEEISVARKTTILLEDDLTGEVLEEGGGETVTFALDGQAYEIDLSGENSTQLRAARPAPPEVVEPAAARALAAPPPRAAGTPARSAPGPGRTATRRPSGAAFPRRSSRHTTRRTDLPADRTGPRSGQRTGRCSTRCSTW